MKKSSEEWYNPNPDNIGEVVFQFITENGRNKAVIIKRKDGNYVVHGYIIDDSDFIAGYDDAVGWVSESGPSFTDSIERAKEIANEYIMRGKGR